MSGSAASYALAQGLQSVAVRSFGSTESFSVHSGFHLAEASGLEHIEELNKLATNFFPRNEHQIERGLRVLVGLGLLSIVFLGPKTLWGLVGLIPLVTGLVGSCPLYTLFGFSTCSTK